MKYRLLLVISIVLLIISIVILVFALRLEKGEVCKIEKETFVELNYIYETTCNLSQIYEEYKDDLKDDFCWWYQIRDESQLTSLCERFDIPDIEYDFSKGYIIVSLGRQLSSLSFWNTDYHFDNTHPALPVFIQEPYDANVAFVYEMDKIPLTNTEYCGLSFQLQNYKETSFSNEFLERRVSDELFPENDFGKWNYDKYRKMSDYGLAKGTD